MAETLSKSPARANLVSQSERHEQGRDPIKFRTFEQASQGKKRMRDDFIIDAMNDTLMIGNEKAQATKRYLDKQPADPTDKAFTRDPEAIGNFHDDLANLICSRIKILAPGATDQEKAFLRDKKDEFLQTTADRRQEVRGFARDWSQGRGGRAPSTAIEFKGFNIPTAQGDMNLLEKPVGNIRANFHVQAESVGSFVHWSSANYLRIRSQNQEPDLNRRIYLNPTAESSVEIFGKIIDAAEQAGIVMKGKIVNRGAEALNNMKSKDFSTRGDGIVLTAGKDADALLALVEAVYNDHQGDFAGRGISRVPFKIAEGVAVGDEPEGEGSLTDTRVALINDVTKETKQVLGVNDWEKIPDAKQQQAVRIFRKKFDAKALQQNINPDNMAFSLRAA